VLVCSGSRKEEGRNGREEWRRRDREVRVGREWEYSRKGKGQGRLGAVMCCASKQD